MDSLTARRFLRYAEYGLLILIIGLIALFLFHRVRTTQKQAERMAVMGEINAMRAGVVAMQDPPEATSQKDLPGMNPVRLLLQTPPKNYLGPVRTPDERDIPPGSWYFRPDKGLLIYKARFVLDFPFTKEPTRRIRLALESPRQLRIGSKRRILACKPDICLTSR